MADSDLGDLYGPRPVRRDERSFGRFLNAGGAMLSLALVAGLGVWGYRLVVRDVSGVPVVRALAGPMRIAPEDPGGEITANQGLTVNEVLAAGEAGEIADQVVLAPETASLRETDLPQGELPRVAETLSSAAPDQLPMGLSDTDSAVLAALSGTDDSGPSSDATGEAVVELASAPGPVTLSGGAAAAVIAAAAPPALIPATVPGVSRSLFPMPRPLAMASGQAELSPVSAPAGDSMEVLPETLAPGERLVQFGAYPSPDLAREAWAGLMQDYPELMAGKKRVIQEATSAGSTFYRLRAAGFTDLADARRFCATVVASGGSCIPTATR